MNQMLTELHVASRLQDLRNGEARREAELWLLRSLRWERRLDEFRRRGEGL